MSIGIWIKMLIYEKGILQLSRLLVELYTLEEGYDADDFSRKWEMVS